MVVVVIEVVVVVIRGERERGEGGRERERERPAIYLSCLLYRDSSLFPTGTVSGSCSYRSSGSSDKRRERQRQRETCYLPVFSAV